MILNFILVELVGPDDIWLDVGSSGSGDIGTRWALYTHNIPAIHTWAESRVGTSSAESPCIPNTY